MSRSLPSLSPSAKPKTLGKPTFVPLRSYKRLDGLPALNLRMACHLAALLLLFLCACSSLVPANTPPQFQHTPGAFVTVSENYFDAGIFQLDYPANWRVVKLSTANTANLRVAFVAPDQSKITFTQVENVDNSVIRLGNGVMLLVEIDASDAADANFFNMANRLANSLRA